MAKFRKKTPTLEEIQEAETGKWVREQLHRLEMLVVGDGADQELLSVIDFLRFENDQTWGNSGVEAIPLYGRVPIDGSSPQTH